MFFHTSWQNFGRSLLLSSRSNWTSWHIFSYELNWKQFKQSVRSVHKSAPFLSDMVHPLFFSVPSVLKNRENYPPPYAHDLAVWPAAHLLDMVISWFSAKLSWAFRQSGGNFIPQTCILTMWDVKEEPLLLTLGDSLHEHWGRGCHWSSKILITFIPCFKGKVRPINIPTRDQL